MRLPNKYLYLIAFSATITVLFIIYLAYIPIPTSKADEERALSLISAALLKNGPVYFYRGDALDDLEVIKRARTIHVIGLPERILAELHNGDARIVGTSPADLSKMVKGDYRAFFLAGNVTVEFNSDGDGHYSFSYAFGDVGAHGYKYVIRKSLFGTTIIITHDWVS